VPRPPLTGEQVRDRVEAYCRRYGVLPGPDGLPPFPAGRRETRQHRDWLSVYRALQRHRRRESAGAPPGGAAAACPVCSRPLEPGLGVPYARRAAPAAALHPACADLARLAKRLGPAAFDGVGRFLWPRRSAG
jgi:hypothetical protein